MTVPVPLGVRLFSTLEGIERWVTRWVEDISFRSVVPGGFASATITLHIPRHLTALPGADVLGFSRLTDLFRRIQVVDLRTQEVAWEGRIEDPARQVEPDTWQIGALGSMVAATDIQRPVFYVDSSMDRWTSGDPILADGTIFAPDGLIFDTSKDDAALRLTIKYQIGQQLNSANDVDYSWRWDSHGYDQAIARFTTTQQGYCSNTTEAGKLSILIGIAANPAIDVTAVNGSSVTKTNTIGTDYTDQNTRYIVVGLRQNTGFYDVIGTETLQMYIRNPKVLGMRRDRFGNKLTTAANYPGDYVTIPQVVEDVIGRFLVGGWYEGGMNTPWPGSVRAADAYIDTSNTTHILHLAYPDGATAADILNDLVAKVQPNAYWALWESAWRAHDGAVEAFATAGYRFEWSTWPNNAGYLATSQDGFEGQPNGDDVANFVFYRYPDDGDGNAPHVYTTWTGSEMVPEMYGGAFTRAVTVNKQDPTDNVTAFNLSEAYRVSKNKITNAGTLTVKRPIQFYDAGQNSWTGAGRMLDPWMIRPGKLIRITDLPPRTAATDLSSGATLPSTGLDGTIFRVVATEYSTRDNSCRLELDQVARWQVPTQISSAADSGPKTIRIQ
jgi:hypothetical protein